MMLLKSKNTSDYCTDCWLTVNSKPFIHRLRNTVLESEYTCRHGTFLPNLLWSSRPLGSDSVQFQALRNFPNVRCMRRGMQIVVGWQDAGHLRNLTVQNLPMVKSWRYLFSTASRRSNHHPLIMYGSTGNKRDTIGTAVSFHLIAREHVFTTAIRSNPDITRDHLKHRVKEKWICFRK